MIQFKNKYEELYYKKLRRKRKLQVDYESERIPFSVERHYIPDFVVLLPSGKKIYIEIKGYLRPADRTKLIRVKAQNPDKDVKIIFLRNNTLSKKSKTLYSEWAVKNGFDYAIDNLPKEWFEE